MPTNAKVMDPPPDPPAIETKASDAEASSQDANASADDDDR